MSWRNGAYHLLRSYFTNRDSVRTALRDSAEAAALRDAWWWADVLGDRAADLSHDFIEETNELGNQLFDQGRFSEAAEAFRHVVAEDYTDYQGLRGLAASLDRIGDLEEAVYYYQSAIVSDPTDPAVRMYLGHALISLGRVDEGIESLRDAYELDPSNSEVVIGLARGLVDFAPEEALNVLDQAEGLAPSEPELWILRAYTHKALGDEPEAWSSTENALKLDPEDAEANLLASWLAQETDAELMLSHAERARDSYRLADDQLGEAIAIGNMAWALFLMDEHESAEQLNLEALRLDPTMASVRFNLGLNRLADGEVEGARQAYQEALDQASLEELRVHGLDDLRTLINRRPNLEGSAEILRALEDHKMKLTTSYRLMS